VSALPEETIDARAVIVGVFVPLVGAFFLSNLFRAINAVIGPDIAADLVLGPSGLGLLTSVFFATFALSQLPVGLVLDRYGPRRVQALLMMVSAAGAVVMALAESPMILFVGRAMVGAGVAASLMAGIAANTRFWAPERRAMMNGLFLAVGATGGIAASVPAEFFAALFGWRGLLLGLAGICVLSAAYIWLVVPDGSTSRDGRSADETLARQIAVVASIFRSPAFWSIAPVAMIQSGTIFAWQGLWAGPWLRDVGGMDASGAARGLFVLSTAMVLGYAGIGTIMSRLQAVGVRPETVVGVSLVAVIAAQLGHVLELTGQVWWLLAMLGFFSTGGSTCYAILAQRFATAEAGRISAAQNLLILSAAFVLQWGIGAVIGLWSAAGVTAYSPDGYRVALIGIMALHGAALVWLIAFGRGEPRAGRGAWLFRRYQS